MPKDERPTALVTGAGSGIGRATALAFTDAGHDVIVADIDGDAAATTVAEIEERGGGGRPICCDVSLEADVAAAVDLAISTYGRLDAACNNAGIVGKLVPTTDYTESGWRRVLDVNLTGVFFCVKHELRAMTMVGSGAIVNIASEAAIKGNAANVAYTAAKHGVVGITKAAALEVAASGIRVNAVCPGVIRTGIIARGLEQIPETVQHYEQLLPNRRMGEPEEIAAAVVWLCSPGASLITGHSLIADGGWAVA
jgi:NAD(P)-dependent dehydrogenase (short-subunit alcohol dehydrogenase family)